MTLVHRGALPRQLFIYYRVIALRAHTLTPALALVARGSDSGRLKYRVRLYGDVKITASRG